MKSAMMIMIMIKKTKINFQIMWSLIENINCVTLKNIFFILFIFHSLSLYIYSIYYRNNSSKTDDVIII